MQFLHFIILQVFHSRKIKSFCILLHGPHIQHQHIISLFCKQGLQNQSSMHPTISTTHPRCTHNQSIAASTQSSTHLKLCSRTQLALVSESSSGSKNNHKAINSLMVTKTPTIYGCITKSIQKMMRPLTLV